MWSPLANVKVADAMNGEDIWTKTVNYASVVFVVFFPHLTSFVELTWRAKGPEMLGTWNGLTLPLIFWQGLGAYLIPLLRKAPGDGEMGFWEEEYREPADRENIEEERWSDKIGVILVDYSLERVEHHIWSWNKQASNETVPAHSANN